MAATEYIKWRKQLISTVVFVIIKKNKRSACACLFLLFFIAGILSLSCNANAGFYAPRMDGDIKTESNITMYVSNSSAATQPRMLYRLMNSTAWTSCALSFFAPSEMNCTLFAENITVQGVYEFYFNSTESRFPEENATLKIALSKRVDNYIIEGDFFAINSSEAADECNPWSTNNSCGYETWQAGMINGYWTASKAASNSTYEGIAYRFSLGEYENLSFYSTCDHADNDYDCDNYNPSDPNKGNLSLVPSGPMRQASLISSLWNAVQYGANTSVRDLAWNYTFGSAQDCDVWSGAFNCTYPDRQGTMISAYWKAYEMTGNQTIKEIAENLSFYGVLMNKSHSYLARGMWKAYEMTDNSTYRALAEELTDEWEIEQCSSGTCSALNLSLNVQALLEAYRVSGKYAYYNYARLHAQENSTGCNSVEQKYSCVDPVVQGNNMISHFLAYLHLPDKNSSLFLPQIFPAPKVATNISIFAHIDGPLTNPHLYFRKTNTSEWQNSTLSFFGAPCIINSIYVGVQTIYEYFFNSSETRFPEGNATLKLALSKGNDTYSEKARSVTETNSINTMCYAWGPSPDYVCDNEYTQSIMIDAFWKAYFVSGNTTYNSKAYRFSLSNYSDISSSCDHAENDFNCSVATTQASLISSLWNAVQYGANTSVRDLAWNYTFGSAQDCNVWGGAFNCTSPDKQGMMILAYWKAYEMTGNQTIREIAENLSSYGVLMNGSHPYMARGMWKAHEMTDNSTYRALAEELTDGWEIERCSSGTCSALNLSLNVQALLEAYRVSANASYSNVSEKSLASGISAASKCDIWANNYSCSYSREQGAMISLLWDAYRIIPVDTKGNLSMALTKTILEINDVFNATCIVENIASQNTSLYDANLSINISSNLELLDNTSSYFFEEIAELESRNITWSIRANSAGTATVRCDVVTSNGWTAYEEESVLINNPPEDPVPEPPSGGPRDSAGILETENTSVEENVSVSDNITEINDTLPEENIDIIAPQIKIIYPYNESILYTPNMTVIVECRDENDVFCTIMIDGLILDARSMFVTPIYLDVTNMTNGTHKLFISCNDIYNNSANKTLLFYVDILDEKEQVFIWPLFIALIVFLFVLALRNRILPYLSISRRRQKRLNKLLSTADRFLEKDDIASFVSMYPKIQKEYIRALESHPDASKEKHVFNQEMKTYLLLKMSAKAMRSVDRIIAEKMMKELTEIYNKIMQSSTDKVLRGKIISAYADLKQMHDLPRE